MYTIHTFIIHSLIYNIPFQVSTHFEQCVFVSSGHPRLLACACAKGSNKYFVFVALCCPSASEQLGVRLVA